ncbi:MAG TPA: glycoside hydrolase family 2 TIM barrel-domain containing protein, partial [Marmoricola sp.]|nr:glycoside hydrolase family 2 TIM barrel-domain containing protein [Marmoricola sp.]
HVKIEPLRWYHHCDRLGMLVWQDMVNGGGRYRSLVANLPARIPLKINDRHHRLFFRDDEAGRSQFLEESDQTVRLLRNVPSICVWVPFNEGWGQFDANAVAERVKALDPTRPVNHVSGWVDQGGGDIRSFHRYLGSFKMPRRLGRQRAVALTEYGGYSVKVAGHDWSETEFGYQHFETLPAFEEAFLGLLADLDRQVTAGLSALVYTQLSDVEDELNGLLTYDRDVLKLSPQAQAAVRAWHKKWAAP